MTPFGEPRTRRCVTSDVGRRIKTFTYLLTYLLIRRLISLPHNDACFIGSRPSDHYFRSVCLFVCLFVCAEFFSAVFDPISIKLGHMLYVWV